MQGILKRLADMQPPEPTYSAAWLGRSLDPPVSRQAVSDWRNVPEHYVEQVATLLGLEPADVRPDLAALFCPKTKPRKRAA